MRVALPRARRGRSSHEALLAAPRRRTAASRCRCRPIYDTVMAVQDGDGRRARSCRSRTRSRARSTRRSTRSRSRPTTCAIVGEVVHPIHHCLIARAAARARPTIRRVVSHPQATAPVRALPARRACRGPAVRAGDLDRRGGAHASPRPSDAVGGARHRAGGRAVRLRRPRRGRRGRGAATRRASSGSRRDGGRPTRASRPRAKTVDRLLGRRRRVARLARALPVRVRVPRRQPDADRVAAAQAGLGHYMFFADLEGATPTSRAVGARRSRRCAATVEASASRRPRLLPRRPELRRSNRPTLATLRRTDDAPRPYQQPPAGGPRRLTAGTSGADVVVAVCSSSTRRSSRSTSARCAAPPCCCSRTKAEVLEHGDVGAALRRAHHAAAPGRDPAGHLRPRPARRAPPQDHAPRRLRARRLDLPVLRRARRASPSTT